MKKFLGAALATLAIVAMAPPASAALPAMAGTEAMPSLSPMIKRAAPAVVNIGVRGTVQQQRGQHPFFDDPEFRRFFGMPPGGGTPQEREFQSAGSGVIVDMRQGYIVTNAHVVENAKDITVTLLDDRELKAEIVGADKGSDVAVLKIKDGKLPAEMRLADSAGLEVGDFVIAIGNPFGLQHTVTSGIVSALGRSGLNPDGYEDFIQTDAAINPGNSGGALVNLRGELVGINSAILSRSGGSMGIGFAIPANMVKSVMDQLIKYGTVKRGLLGVSILSLNGDYRQSLGLGADVQGALVSQVVEGSAAAKAGIEAGDVITSVNGQPVKGAAELRNQIGMLRVGQEVELGLIRDTKPRKVKALIAEAAPDAVQAEAGDAHSSLAGAELADATTAQVAGGGVLIRSVEPGSPAAAAGLRANDLILGVNRVRVTNLATLREALKDRESFLLQLRRGGQNVILPIR
ncbi:MAG: DegQ family serine endoprotease [Steroidobacteraceae bacterium]|nr:DegQ family serine endoprotease [Steroidobacteraceae bacterium]MCC7200677.1 DegQ family serine endoprotease [Gammaproteobacteria bacterium]